MIEFLPTLLDLHPTVSVIITHMDGNDVMMRNSLRMQADMESLCYTIESLGKRCIVLGPIPTTSKKSERFSRLYNFHLWLQNFCTASGYDFISNFDYFWGFAHLYISDGMHLNYEGTMTMRANFINYIAFKL